MPNTSSGLRDARQNKFDEFYTRAEDIKKELKHYKAFFKDKVVYCNCDNPDKSMFWKFFFENFKEYKLKKLMATFYNSDYFGVRSGDKIKSSHVYVYDGNEMQSRPIRGNGDFRGHECIKLMENADVAVTNPPFSLFRDYIKCVMNADKKFLILGNINAVTYMEVFPLIKANKMWLGETGFNTGMYFYVPDDFVYMKSYKFTKEMDGKPVSRVPGICWFTNINYESLKDCIKLKECYSPDKYKKYDNYDAIEVKKTGLIPMDYKGAMGVPISYLNKHDPSLFEIIGIDKQLTKDSTGKVSSFLLNGKETYCRIVIRHKS